MVDSQPHRSDSPPASPIVASEATPLLSSTTEQGDPSPAINDDNHVSSEVHEASAEDSPAPRTARTIIVLTILTTLSLVFSFITITFATAVFILTANRPSGHDLPWTLSESLGPIFGFVRFVPSWTSNRGVNVADIVPNV